MSTLMARGVAAHEDKKTVPAAKQVHTRSARLGVIDKEYRSNPDLEHLRYRSHYVPGHGNEQPKIMLIFEAPNEFENKSRKYLVGPIAKVMGDLLRSIDMKPQHCYATAVVKYRPPVGRDPRPDEVFVSMPYLWREIEVLKPTVIVPMGRTPTLALLGHDVSMNLSRGVQHTVRDYLVIPMLNPLSMLAHPSLRTMIFEDFQKVGCSV